MSITLLRSVGSSRVNCVCGMVIRGLYFGGCVRFMFLCGCYIGDSGVRGGFGCISVLRMRE